MASPMRRLVVLLPAALSLTLLADPGAAQSPSPPPSPSPSASPTASPTVSPTPSPPTASPSPSPGSPQVRLRLAEQTLWNGPDRPLLDLRFRATNEGPTPVEDLTVGVTLFGRVLSRTAYERSLVADPSPVVVIDAETYARDGALEPGDPRVFEVTFMLDAGGIDPTQSGIYPLKIDLRSDGVPVADIRTPVVYLVREPEQPLALSWTLVLHHPITFGPDGVFTSASLEEELAPGGRIGGLTQGLLELTRATADPVDLAVSPLLLMQLARMSDGYSVEDAGQLREVPPERDGAATAAATLEALREIVAAPQVSLSALPLAAPEIPSMLSSGLGRDLDVQLARGRELVGAILRATPDPTVLRPPAGVLDEAALEALAIRGVRLVALDPGAVQSPLQPLGFAPPPVTSLRREGDLVGLVPDPAVSTLLASPLVTSDPVLGAHVVLGELASIWQEQPGQARGLAMVLSEELDLPGGFYRELLAGVAGAPWLRPVRGRDLVAAFPRTDRDALVGTFPSTFSPSYVSALKQTRRRIEVYRSMLVEESTEPERLELHLLLAEGGQFLRDPATGFAFVRDADDTVSAVFDAISVDASQVVTLTSRSGATLPVRVASDAAEPLRVQVGLVSQYLVRSPTEELVLLPGDARSLTFDVDLKTTGRFPVIVRVVAPTGRVIEQASITVRSTAYNRIALVITIAAALALVLLWARRFLPRRTT